MRSILLTLLISLTPMCEQVASASQVFTVCWDKFQIEANGIKLSGTEGERGITSLKIKAFKKTFKLTEAEIKELEGFTANGLAIGGETGWAMLGGFTYSVSFPSKDEKLPAILVLITELQGLKIQKQK